VVSALVPSHFSRSLASSEGTTVLRGVGVKYEQFFCVGGCVAGGWMELTQDCVLCRVLRLAVLSLPVFGAKELISKDGSWESGMLRHVMVGAGSGCVCSGGRWC